MKPDYTITFACYNQLEYTQKFIESLNRNEVDFSRIVAVDNGSTDGTREWLAQQGFGQVVLNHRNLGCGAAWNQGALALQSTWTVVMNNDVVCAEGWLDGLLHAAETNALKIACPSMVEGDLDYDFPVFAQTSAARMSGYCRLNAPHAVCMAIHESVWNDIGYFMPVPKLLGYEDAIFFQRVLENNIKTGTTGDSWLHHFGMTTQKALKMEMKLEQSDSLGNRNLMRLYMNQSWVARKIARYERRKMLKESCAIELARFNMTVHSVRQSAVMDWR
jgi:GT2 family glycosyltransferase